MTSHLGPIPLIVLAGSDRKPGRLPEGASERPLVGSKGIDLRIGDRPMIDVTIERLRSAELFDPIFIAGPVSKYGVRRGDVDVIDTDGSLGTNIANALGWVLARHEVTVLGVATCDILPTVEDLRLLVEHYRKVAPVHFWFPLVPAPADPTLLGASSWKPRYLVSESRGEEPRAVLPGHILICDPHAARTETIFRAFDIIYKTRNQPVIPRMWRLIFGLLGTVLRQDWNHLRHGRRPFTTWITIYNAFKLGFRLARGRVTRRTIENLLHRTFFRYHVRLKQRDRRGWFPILEALSIAKDIDTVEEAEETQRRFESS